MRVVRFNDEPVAEPIAVEFGPTGGTIGRATDCTLVLPDQQRAISRVHARIEFRGGEYLLCDLGSNPSVLNQRALGGTREARLANGDRLMIGTYLLEVTIAKRAATGARSVTGLADPLAAVKVLGGPLPADAQGDPFGLGALDPLGQPAFGERPPIASAPRYAGSESDHVAPEFQAFAAPGPASHAAMPPVVPSVASPSSGGIPADYDPLADALAQWETPVQPGGVQAGAAHASPPFAAPPSDAPFNAFTSAPSVAPAHAPAPSVPASPGGPTGLSRGLLDGPAGHDVATPFDDLLAPAAGPPLVPEDPTEIAPAASLAAAMSVPVEPVPAPVEPAAQQPPPRQREPACAAAATAEPAPRATPAAAPSARPDPAASHDRASEGDPYAALLEGLGLDPSRMPNLPPAELARLVGTMLREALRGTMAVLRARSMARREARLDVTLIVARDNNPLKFFPDVDSALAQMLTGRGAGYLPPAEALERAFNDIESHELAVIVGMRAALADVLGRFDPASIEAQLKEGGVLDKVLSNRKAKLWDLFVEREADVAREAQDDFQRLFGKAFNDAYEAQIDALHTARKTGKTDPTSHH
nr:type VI secretion system-associated FHA domain protein TagH [Paraburkholderia sp. Tr-20389]